MVTVLHCTYEALSGLEFVFLLPNLEDSLLINHLSTQMERHSSPGSSGDVALCFFVTMNRQLVKEREREKKRENSRT